MSHAVCRNKNWEYWALACDTPVAWLRDELVGLDAIHDFDGPPWPELYALHGVQQDPVWHPEGDALQHTLHVCGAMRTICIRDGVQGEARGVLMLAALCHDLGKADTTEWNEAKQKWTSYGHDVAGVPLARRFLDSIGTYSEVTDQVLPLVRWHMVHTRAAHTFTTKSVKKLLAGLEPSNLISLLRLMEADTWGRPPLAGGLPKDIDQLVAVANELWCMK